MLNLIKNYYYFLIYLSFKLSANSILIIRKNLFMLLNQYINKCLNFFPMLFNINNQQFSKSII